MAYGMKLTTIGAAKLLAAATDETEITFSKIVWGNANGVAYEPTGEETALVNQIHSTSVLAVDIDPERPNVYRVDGELTSAPSEFTLLEVGILDEDDDLIAIGNHPPQFVPGPSSTFTLNYHPSWFLVISPELAVAVTLTPPGDFATEEWVTANFQPKGTYVKTVVGTGGVVVEGTATDRSARADEAWFNSRYRRRDDADPGVQGVGVTTGVKKTGADANPTLGFDIAWGDARYRGIADPFPLPYHIHPNATQSSDGFFSKEDKTKLDGLNGSSLPGLFQKVAETVITSSRSYIDILNVSGGSLYFVRATALRASPEPAVDLPTYIQFGNNSTLYASVGDYHKYGSGYSQSVSDKPYFDATSIASGGTTWITGPVIRALPTVDGVRNMVSFGIKYLGSAAKKTSLVNLGAGVRLGDLATIDDDWDRGTLDGVFAVRAAAVAENRLRILTTPGYQFIGGRVSVYSFGA